MNELQIFNSPEFGDIRTVMVENEPMFCLSDVCRALEITNVGNVKQRLSEKGIRTMDTLTKGGSQKLLYINEANLYKTIFQSRKESAQRFTDWVTDEVLPSIRKNGGYIAGQETLSDEELMAKAILVAQKKIAERDKIIEKQRLKIEADKPKTIFCRCSVNQPHINSYWGFGKTYLPERCPDRTEEIIPVDARKWISDEVWCKLQYANAEIH